MPNFSYLILDWYDHHARNLPWRGIKDPYAVWISEIMLQQTRVETVIPYFQRWMVQFPRIQDLAQAPLQKVLSAWEGLGYYSRCRNLHRAAQIVLEKYDGKLPGEIHILRTLPGIGRYTAAAIASIAFNQDIAALDGNIRRVLARVFALQVPADLPEGEKILWDLAQDHLALGRAGDYNQALMDFGAVICLPRNPLCHTCPLNKICLSIDSPESRPILRVKGQIPHKIKMAAVINIGEQILLNQRSNQGLLGGLWEFPASEVKSAETENLVTGLDLDYHLNVRPIQLILKIRHAYTHFSVIEYAWECLLDGNLKISTLKWVNIHALDDFPMGKIDRSIARKIISGNR